MRGIKFNLNKFEFNVVQEELYKAISFHSINGNGLKLIALRNVMQKFEKKLNRANERKGGIRTMHF